MKNSITFLNYFNNNKNKKISKTGSLTWIILQQLKDKCKELKIKDYGTKVLIVKRIEQFISSEFGCIYSWRIY